MVFFDKGSDIMVKKIKQRKPKKVYINKYGVKIPYTKIQRGQKLKDEVDTLRLAKRQYLYGQPYQQYGASTTTTVEQLKMMSPTAFQELNPVTFNPDVFKSQKDVDRKLSTLSHMKTKKFYRDKNRQYKKNFIASIDTVFKGKVPEDEINQFKKIINRMNADEIASLRYKGELNDIESRYINSEYMSNDDILKYFQQEYTQLYEMYKEKYNIR